MANSAELLSQLRDVREPLPPEGIELWLVAANAAALIAVIILLWHYRQRRRYAWRHQFIKDLRQAHSKPADVALGIAATGLRQVMLYRGDSVEALSGESWLIHLDQSFSTQWFTRGDGQIFGNALYRPVHLDSSQVTRVLQQLEKLLKTLPPIHTSQANST